MAVNDILEIGRQGLNANRQAMQTTSNNVANANTPGYTRRRAVMETNGHIMAHGQQFGGGVDVKKVMRVHDDFVQKQIVDESQALGSLRVKAETLGRLESVVAKEAEHLGQSVTKFFNDYRELSANPEMAALRDVVGASAEALGDGMHRMNDTLELMKREMDLRIGNTVEQVNTKVHEIAGLNETIVQAESRGEVPNDLYDRREMLVRELSQHIDVQVNSDQRNQTTIVSGGTVLVQGNDFAQLSVGRTPATEEKTAGQVDVFVKPAGGGERAITTVLKDGELAGMIHVRDKVIGEAQRHLDKVAFGVTQAVNSVHVKGVGLDGVAGRQLFADVGEKTEGAAFRFGVSDDVRQNREAVAAGLAADAPGDNQIALEIADLQNWKGLSGTSMGTSENHTINESLNALVGRVGVETQREKNFYDHQAAVVEHLENYRQSISGVSLEEEAVNLIQYQTVFNASAKAMHVGQELFDTILSLKS